MAKIYKLIKGGQTIYPATTTDAVKHPGTGTSIDALINEINVSVVYPTGGVTADNIQGGNRYTLETAIDKVPVGLRRNGLKVSFVGVTGEIETWEYQGGGFTNRQKWFFVEVPFFVENKFYSSFIKEFYIEGTTKKLFVKQIRRSSSGQSNPDTKYWQVAICDEDGNVIDFFSNNYAEDNYLEFSGSINEEKITVKLVVNWSALPENSNFATKARIEKTAYNIKNSPYLYALSQNITLSETINMQKIMSKEMDVIREGSTVISDSIQKESGYFFFKKTFQLPYVMDNTSKLLMYIADSQGSKKNIPVTGLYYTIGFSDGSTESFQFVLDTPVCLYYKKPIASLTVYVGFDDSQVSQDDKLFIEMRELSYKIQNEDINGGLYFNDYLLGEIIKEFYYVRKTEQDNIGLRYLKISDNTISLAIDKDGNQVSFIREMIPASKRTLVKFVEDSGGPDAGGYGYALLDLNSIKDGMYSFKKNCKMPCYDITNSPYIYAYITSQNINRSGEALSVRDKLQAQESVNDKIEFCKQYISNKNASLQTIALYYNLRRNAFTNNVLYGQEEDFTCGIRNDGTPWANQETNPLYVKKVDNVWVEKASDEIDLSLNSGIYDMAGKFGNVLALDLNKYLNFHFSGENELAEFYKLTFISLVKKYYKEVGGVITFCYHANNPYGDGSFDHINSTYPNAFYQILNEKDGGVAKKWFDDFLRSASDFFNLLVDEEGNKIPIIFRPFHECAYSMTKWWNNCTSEEYKEVWRRMVRHINGMCTNVLWAYNPGVNPLSGEDSIFERYAGDEYVDVVGSDIYFNDSVDWSEDITPDTGNKIESFLPVIRRIVIAAELRNKIPCLPETGNKFASRANFYTNQLYLRLLMQYDVRLAYMTTWYNLRGANDVKPYFYTPYIKDSAKGRDYIEFLNKKCISKNLNLYEFK